MNNDDLGRHRMKLKGGEFEAGQLVAIDRTRIQAYFVVHDERLWKRCVTENDLFPEVILGEKEGVANPYEVHQSLILDRNTGPKARIG